MALPSKYAPDSLSVEDQRKVIVSKDERIRRPPNYIIETIEKKIDDAVRNQKSEENDPEDIEMVPIDNYEEVTMISEFVNKRRNSQSFLDMEIDEYAHAPENDVAVSVVSYLIVDTNFFLSHLKMIDRLKEIGEKYRLMIVVPLTVMKELDGLKKSDRMVENSDELSGSSVGHLARWANDWIYSCLATKTSTVKGQRYKERLDVTATQDDSILDCALYFKKTFSPSLTTLLSNDKNLCMKALANDILTVSYSKNMTADLIAQKLYDEMNSTAASPTLMNQPRQVSYISDFEQAHSPQHVNEMFDSHNDSPYSTVFREVEKLVLSMVHQCMVNAYGDDIDLIRDYDKSSVKNLSDCLNIITRFWISVFSSYFRHDEFFVFDKKTKKQKNPVMSVTPQNSLQLREFIQTWSTFLQRTYKAEMKKEQNEALQSLLQRWNQFSSSLD